MDAVKVGKSIAFLRKRYHMTQRNVADILGISDKAVSKWERGIGTPDISLLGKLAMIFDTDIESILEGNLANLDLHWCGLLELRYHEGIQVQTLVYDKPAVYLQMAYIMLAGIHQIYVVGDAGQVDFVRKRFGNGESLGLRMYYWIKKPEEKQSNLFTQIRQEQTALDGLMVIDGLDFIYGKDVTKTFRRIIYNEQKDVRFNRGLHLLFHRFRGREAESLQNFERGVQAFPIQDYQSLLDAGNIVSIIQRYQEKCFMDLHEIAWHRGFISSSEVGFP